MFLFPEDTSDVKAGIGQPGHCLLINCFQTNPAAWMMKNGGRCHCVVSSLLLQQHLRAAVKAIPHLCTVERNKPTPVRRRLRLTKDGLGGCICSGLFSYI